MFSSHILSRLLRFGLLAFFIVGLFVFIGELSVNQGGTLSLSQGGIYSAVAEEGATGGGAATPGANDTKTTEPESKTLEAFIDIANLFIGVLTFLITPLIMLAGWLLSPDWTFGEIFGLRPILHQIWIFISNIVYVIFGFFLVFIAFANIFGGESAKAYEMKTMLPKLVIGILIVPFTWFIVSAVLSISNILTASVIQLPIDTIQKAGSAGTFLDDKIIPKTIVYNKDHDYDKDKDAGGNIDSTYDKKSGGGVAVKDEYKANGNFYATDCDKAPDGCLSIQEFLSNGKGGAYNLLSVYAYGIFKIQDYKRITAEQKLKTLGGIASKLSFSFLFFIVFGILIIAIVYALFSRALILWLYAMFSPIFALNYVMEFKNESVKGSVGRMSIEKFLSLALVPVYVSAALAFGLMFLGLVMNAKGATPTGAGGENGKITGDIVQGETKDGISTFTFGDVKLTTKGVLTGDQKKGLNGALDLGKGVIGTIIMNVLALVILWMAVMAALNADEVTKSAVAPIKSFGDEVGKLAMKSPQYIPIPLPGGSKVSMAGMSSVITPIKSSLDNIAQKQGAAIGQKFAPSTDSLTEIANTMKSKNAATAEGALTNVHEMLKTGKTKDYALNNFAREELGNQLESFNKYHGFKNQEEATKIIKELKESNNAGEIKKLLSKLDGLSEGTAYGSILGGAMLIKPENVDNYMGGNAISANNKKSIEIVPKSGGTQTDYSIKIGETHGSFDIGKDIKIADNIKSLAPVSGLMTESEFTEKMKDYEMDAKYLEDLIKELKDKKFFKDK